MAGDSEPVVIGGLRGSGTRVAAHLVRELGFHLGDDLNQALDNQCFAFLIGGRPEWRRARPDQVPLAIGLFEKAMRGHATLDAAEVELLDEAVLEWDARLKAEGGVAGTRAEWLRGRVEAIEGSSGIPAEARGWGWKNPIAHLFVEQLADAFPRMKYAHVIRDGADLASKAKTRREAHLWGAALGVGVQGGSADAQRLAVLRYWDAVNRRAQRLGPELFGERFLCLGYESLCARPRDAVAEVGDFLDVRPPPGLAGAFSGFVDPRLSASR